MSFKQYLAEGARLDEGFLRSAALLAWANKSKVDGSNTAALQDVKQAPLAGKSTESFDD